MSRGFPVRPPLPLADGPAGAWPGRLTHALDRHLTDMGTAVTELATGRLAGTVNAQTAAPTGGRHALGDFVRNSQPAEAGGAGSMYVILGWVCTAAGNPGTWLECRVLTGN